MPIAPLALVLDLDGTLVDSLPDLVASLSHTLRIHGRPGVNRAQLRSMLGDGAELLVQRAFAATGNSGTAGERSLFLVDFLAHYQAHSADHSRCFEGVRETLAQLRADGHKLGVCSNKPHQACLDLVAAMGLGDAVDAVLGGDALPQRKPDPEHLWATVRAMDAQGRPVVMVGDSAPDARVAQNAGVPFVLAAYGYHRVPLDQLPSDAVIGRFDELPGVLERLSFARG